MNAAKRRLHKTAARRKHLACQTLAGTEIEAVQAAASLSRWGPPPPLVLGRRVAIQKERGRFQPTPSGAEFLVNGPPSFLLRIPEPAQKGSGIWAFPWHDIAEGAAGERSRRPRRENKTPGRRDNFL